MTRRQFTKLFHTYAEAIYRFAYWKVSDEDRARDIVSTVFSKAWEKREMFDGREPQAWLFSIARNTVIDTYRRKEAVPIDTIEEPTSEDQTADKIDASIDNAKLARALNSLSDVHRELVQWRFIERKSVREVAKLMSMTEANIRTTQHRVLIKLREWYEKKR